MRTVFLVERHLMRSSYTYNVYDMMCRYIEFVINVYRRSNDSITRENDSYRDRTQRIYVTVGSPSRFNVLALA